MIVTVGVLLLLAAGVAILLRGGREDPTEVHWDSYMNAKLESTERLLGPAARRLWRGSAVARISDTSRAPEGLKRDLELGGAFGGDLGIFYSMQLAAMVISGACLAFSFLDGISGLNRFVLVGIGLIVSYWPINKVRTSARKKRALILEELPEFADLLLMVLSSMSVPQALNFTTERTEGVIAAEMKDLVRSLAFNAMPPEAAFAQTAARLGTAEGREFVAALQSSYLDGATAVENVTAQAENLRMLKYQQQRANAKKLPVSLVITFAIHFMPLLFILAFLPVLTALTGLGS